MEEINLLEHEINKIYLKFKNKGFIPENYFKADYSQLEREFHKEIYLQAEKTLMYRISEMDTKQKLEFIQRCNKVWNKEINK